MKDMCIYGCGNYKNAWMRIGGTFQYKKGFQVDLEISDIDGYVPGDRPKIILSWRDLSSILLVLDGTWEESNSGGVKVCHDTTGSYAYVISTDEKHTLEIDECSALALSLVIRRLIVKCAIEDNI